MYWKYFTSFSCSAAACDHGKIIDIQAFIYVHKWTSSSSSSVLWINWSFGRDKAKVLKTRWSWIWFFLDWFVVMCIKHVVHKRYLQLSKFKHFSATPLTRWKYALFPLQHSNVHYIFFSIVCHQQPFIITSPLPKALQTSHGAKKSYADRNNFLLNRNKFSTIFCSFTRSFLHFR